MAFAIDFFAPTLIGLIFATLLAAGTFVGLLWLVERRFSLGLAEDLTRMFPRLGAFFGLPHRIASEA
jgi:hypothetical protein